MAAAALPRNNSGKGRHRKTPRGGKVRAGGRGTGPKRDVPSPHARTFADNTAGYARFVGRVGALAVALGVGAAVATGQGFGVGVARAEEPGTTTDAPAGAGPEQAENPGEQGSPEPSNEPPAPVIEGGVEGEGPGETTEDNAYVPEMNYSGGVEVDEDNDTEQTTEEEAKEEEETPPPPGEITSPPAALEGPGVPAGAGTQGNSTPPAPPPPAGVGVGSSDDTPLVAESNTDDSLDAAELGGPTVMRQMSSPDDGQDAAGSGQSMLLSTTGEESELNALAPVTQPGPVEALLSIPGTIVTVATTVVAALLSPFLAPGPVAPAQPPLLFVLLGWVQREIQRTFFNSTPDAVEDTVTTSEDVATTLNVLANDADFEGDTISITSFTQPANGTVVRNADGTFTYTPDDDFNGTDTFTYTVRDQGFNIVHDVLRFLTGSGPRTDTATVTINVTAVPDAVVVETLEVGNNPVAVEVGFLPDGELVGYVSNADDGTVTVLEYDDDTDGWSVGATIEVGPHPGRLVLDAERAYVINQGDGTLSRIDRRTNREIDRIFVGDATDLAVAELPGITDDRLYVVDSAGTLMAIDTREFRVVGRIELGRELEPAGMRAAAEAPTLRTPPRVAVHPDRTKVYVAIDRKVVAVSNSRAAALEARSAGDEAAIAAASAEIGDALEVFDSVELLGEVTAMRLTEDGRRLVAAVSREDELGRAHELAQVSVDRARMEIAAGVVRLDGAGTGLAISAGGTRGYVRTDTGMSVVDLDRLGVVDKLDVGRGSGVTKVPGRGRVLVTDAEARRVSVISDPVDDPTVVNGDNATVDEDSSVEIDVLANDVRSDGAEILTTHVVVGPSSGTVTVNPSGTITYTPNANFHGTDVFAYSVTDGTSSSNVATVTVIVNPVDDPTVIRLDWQTEADLDSHLTGPSATLDGERFHVSFENLTHDPDGIAPIDAQLFGDDVDGFGPETTEINVLRPGDYHFYVHNYPGSASVTGNGATVTVTDVDDPGLDSTFTTADRSGSYWSVFKLTVSETGAMTLTPIDEYGDDEPTLEPSTA